MAEIPDMTAGRPSVLITPAEAEAATQLLRDMGAADLIGMLIDPDQIGEPPTCDPRVSRPRLSPFTAFMNGRKIA